VDEAENKKAFAIALLHTPDDSFAAATKVFPNNPAKALTVHGIWVSDLDVKEYQVAYLSSHGEAATLPSKEKVSREIYAIASDRRTPIEDRLKAYKLYGDMRGYIEKPGTTIDARTQKVTHNVMIVNSSGDDDAWAKKVKAQQERLISDSN